jgi:hypothetical protein
MIIWSYSIYGSNTEVYYKPMLENIQLAKSNNVTIVISTTEKYVGLIKNFFEKELEYIHIITFPSQIYSGAETILRFLAVEKIEADFYFIKDSDTIVTLRELYIMNHWMLMTKYDYMIIRDNPIHVSPILSGMFGFRRNVRLVLTKSCSSTFSKPNVNLKYGFDQQWLTEAIYSRIFMQVQVYSSYFYFYKENIIRLSRVRDNSNFIGAQSIGNINPNSKESNFLHFYGNDLLYIPFLHALPKFISRLIFGRVRPSLYFAYLIKLIKI